MTGRSQVKKMSQGNQWRGTGVASNALRDGARYLDEKATSSARKRLPGKGGADGQEKRKVRLLLRPGNITLYRIPLRSLPARYIEGALFPDPPFQSSDGTISYGTANDQANIYFCTFFRASAPFPVRALQRRRSLFLLAIYGR